MIDLDINNFKKKVNLFHFFCSSLSERLVIFLFFFSLSRPILSLLGYLTERAPRREQLTGD
jgi:hypothetical protein